MPLRRATCAAVLCSFAAGCAGAAGAPATLSDWRPPPGQRCSPVLGRWDALPSVGEVADSLALARHAQTLRAPGSYVLYSVRYDAEGMPRDGRILESGVEPPPELMAGVLEALRPLAEGGPRRLRVRLDGAPAVQARIGASEECLPVVEDRAQVSRLLEIITMRERAAGQVTLRILVGTDGRPAETRMHVSSGDAVLDGQLLAAAMELRFHPALLDREPVAVWTQLPLSVRPPRR